MERPIELKDTVELMLSDDYKDRFLCLQHSQMDKIHRDYRC